MILATGHLIFLISWFNPFKAAGTGRGFLVWFHVLGILAPRVDRFFPAGLRAIPSLRAC
jgi:hypothetical protein